MGNHIKSKLCIPNSPYILKQRAQTSSIISDEHNHIGNLSDPHLQYKAHLALQNDMPFDKSVTWINHRILCH